MPNTPAVDPPIVTRDDARLLVHEAAFSAILAGMKKVLPQLFLYGSFNVDPIYKREPIHIPNPTGGSDILLNYRVDFDNFAIDIAPSDITVGSFPDPFNLDPGTIALHAQITIDLAGNPVSAWQARVSIQVWLKCKMSFGSDGWLTFELLDAMIRIDQLMNTGLIAALNNIIHDYLHTVILQLRLPITPLASNQWISISPTALLLQLDAADLSFKVTVQ
jgi:hypothetical protein